MPEYSFVQLVDENLYVTGAASAVAVIAAYYVFNVARKPVIHTSNENLRQFLSANVPSLKEKYWPSWYAWEGRLQSALGLKCRVSRSLILPYRREILQLSDGGQVGIDILGEETLAACKPEDRMVVLLLGGLTSSFRTQYIKTLTLSIINAGASVVFVNYRGQGDVPLTTPRAYCASNDSDLREVVAYMKRKYPGIKMMAVGASLGGMLLSRYLVDRPEEAKASFLTIMILSICWDPMIGSENLEKNLLNKYIVNYAMAYDLKSLAFRYRSILESRNCWDFNKILQAKTIREFDNSFTCPDFGYASYQDYYKACAIDCDIHKFPIPVVALNALDDPLQPEESLPIKQAEAPDSQLALLLTSRGGHLGFLEGNPLSGQQFHYMERIVGEYVRAIRVNVHRGIDRETPNCY